MTDSKRTQGEQLAIGTISVLRTLVELKQAGAIDLPIDDFVETQRQRGDNKLADAFDALLDQSGGS